MNDWGYDDLRPNPGPGGLLLVMGVALGAAAFLLGTAPGRLVRRQLANRTQDWTVHAAEILAQNREKLIAAVEQQTGGSSGPVREKTI